MPYWEDLSVEEKGELKAFLASAHEVVDKADSGQIPLYEAIMLMNKVIIHHQMERNENIVPLSRSEEKKTVREVSFEAPVEKKDTAPSKPAPVKNALAAAVFEDPLKEIEALKQRMDTLLNNLNSRLRKVGYQLQPIEEEN